MFPQNIKEILQKYQSDNKNSISEINGYITNIIKCLYDINQNLADQAKILLLDKNTNNNISQIIEDSIVIRDYINSIQLINQDNISLECYVDEISDEISQPLFDKKVFIFLISDDLCPFCGYKLSQHIIHYQRIKHNVLLEENIKWHKCPECKKLFVLDFDAEDFDFSSTNIILNKSKYEMIPEIDINTVVVLENTLKCSFKHNTKQVIANIPGIDKNGDFHYYSVSASYCFECNRFTILKEEFEKINDVITCKVIDETYNYKPGESDQNNDSENDCSILKYYGYNVQTKKDISEQQRHIILSSIIEAKIMDRRQVIDLLNINIKRKSTRPDSKLAIQKWKDDIDFVNTYKTEELPKVVFDKIILKYKYQT